MSNVSGDAQVSNRQETSHVISVNVERDVSDGNEEMKLVKDTVRSLPADAVKDLLSIEVCLRCIFRLFGIHLPSCSSHSQRAVLCSILGESAESDKYTEAFEPKFCRICLGILQFSYYDGKEILVRQENAKNFAVTIADLVKKEGHQIDSFSLEVSIPMIILENEHMVWLYVKKKYGSELWFQERSLTEGISVKDALKFALADPLETFLGVKCYLNSFRIRLTYTLSKATKMVLKSIERNEGCKRQKIGTENGLGTAKNESVVDECTLSTTIEVNAPAERSSNGLQDDESSYTNQFLPEKAIEPCCLECLCYSTPIYFGGRYLKYSRNVSQTRWIIDEERMGEASIEEIIGGSILPMCQGDSYKFHAAGREDIDVRMLGSGRPFLVEVQNARKVPSELFVKEIETKINNLENKLVKVKNLKAVGSQGWNLMREGEAEKQKQYAALVWLSRPLQDEDLQTISSFKEMQILQKTPIRVLHRRSPLEREKIIHWMKIEKIAGSSQYFLLHLCTQAGTYIKEFVHGDLGRTTPSIGSLLGCRAEILQLDVTDVKMDCFLTE